MRQNPHPILLDPNSKYRKRNFEYLFPGRYLRFLFHFQEIYRDTMITIQAESLQVEWFKAQYCSNGLIV
jgi:hypothetical protein